MVIVAGLDPSASPRKYSGVAVLDDYTPIHVSRLKSDLEIITTILSFKPLVVAIDSPLSHAETYREVDLILKRMGFRVLPPGWRGMKLLVERSLKLKKLMEENGVAVIETHPLSAVRSSGCKDHISLLAQHGIVFERELSRDEYDAVVSALVARYYVSGSAVKIEASDGVVYLLPRICR